jgi:hypothetical protein
MGRTGHPADGHDLIRVQGARVNNLKDVSVELPKRRLTVFTGVSGSGKSSLVFGTIAAESQRMINETYSAFVQGFMPTLARPRSTCSRADDRDHRRPGADGREPALHRRHRHRRQRDAAHPVQPARAAVRRARHRLRLQRPDPRRERRHATEKGGRRRRASCATRLPGRDVPALRGHGLGQRHRPHALYDETQSLPTGALTCPGYSMDGWYGRIFSGAGCRWTSRSRSTRRRSCSCSSRGADQDQGRGRSTSPTRG